MCQTMEMIRIPTTIQEITRNHDRALINLERLPSGYKVRQRIYRDFQEPMLNVAHEQFGDNPLNTYSSSSGTANTSQVGTENTNLLPNPFSKALVKFKNQKKSMEYEFAENKSTIGQGTKPGCSSRLVRYLNSQINKIKQIDARSCSIERYLELSPILARRNNMQSSPKLGIPKLTMGHCKGCQCFKRHSDTSNNMMRSQSANTMVIDSESLTVQKITKKLSAENLESHRSRDDNLISWKQVYEMKCGISDKVPPPIITFDIQRK
ncbi:hypothetical protein GJ496_001193 [Pomphorhynchus laevis]|nr:hypothetical protein GJ496_001193 [Pomphorhynchus laevis]